MVLTRQQRRSGINVTPTASEKKDTAKSIKKSTRKNKATKVENKPTKVENKPTKVENKPTKKNKATKVENKATKVENKATKVELGMKEIESLDLTPPQEDGGLNIPRQISPRKKSSTVGLPAEHIKTTHGKTKPEKVSPCKSKTENDDTSDDNDEQDSPFVINSKLGKSSVNKQNKPDVGVEDNVIEESTTTSKENNHTILNVKGQELVEESSDDDDDAPESMTFDVARDTALETLHQAYKESLKIKSKKKEKRRAHDTMMKEQAKKKTKLCEELESNRLPETFLKQVNTENIDRQKTSEFESDGDEDVLDDEYEDELSKDGGDDDYVIEKEGFQIVPLQTFAKRPVVKSMDAFNFRQEQLYGKRIPRVTAPSHISMSLKRSSKPAMNFKVKGLAVTKKERRLKKNNWSNLVK